MSTFPSPSPFMTTREYAEEWSKRSDKHLADGDYPWMVSRMPASETILEIGCGSGRATLELVKAGKKVIAVENNDDLSTKATAYLKEKGVAVASIWAKELIDRQPVDPSVFADHQVFIISANLFQRQCESLVGNVAFDGIVCWLIGAAPDHIAEIVGDNLASGGTESLAEKVSKRTALYRERVQARCGELGRSLLVSGGFVHVVDRCHPGVLNEGDGVAHDLAKDYGDVLKFPFSVSTKDVEFRAPGLSVTDSQMTFVSAATRSIVPSDVALVSVIAKR